MRNYTDLSNFMKWNPEKTIRWTDISCKMTWVGNAGGFITISIGSNNKGLL